MFPWGQQSICPCHPRTKSKLPSFKVHLMEPVLLLTACKLPSRVDTNNKVSGSVTVLGLPKICNEMKKNLPGQHDSSPGACATRDLRPRKFLKSTSLEMRKLRMESVGSQKDTCLDNSCVRTKTQDTYSK